MKRTEIALGMPALPQMADIAQCAALCAELSLSFVELNMCLPEYQPGRLDERAVERAKSKHGVYCTLHLDEQCNPFDFNPLVSEAYLETIRFAIRLARRHRMPVINMHMPEGSRCTLPGEKIYLVEQYQSIFTERLKAFRALCEHEIGDSGLVICIENCNGFAQHTKNAIEALLDSDIFGLTLDVGHNHCANEADWGFIDRHMERLSHMHLHDAVGNSCHLPLGAGEIHIAHWMALCAERGCRAVVEVKTAEGLRRSKEWLDAAMRG